VCSIKNFETKKYVCSSVAQTIYVPMWRAKLICTCPQYEAVCAKPRTLSALNWPWKSKDLRYKCSIREMLVMKIAVVRDRKMYRLLFRYQRSRRAFYLHFQGNPAVTCLHTSFPGTQLSEAKKFCRSAICVKESLCEGLANCRKLCCTTDIFPLMFIADCQWHLDSWLPWYKIAYICYVN
jgi:hypothetical protein